MYRLSYASCFVALGCAATGTDLAAQNVTPTAPIYHGAGSCNSANCHGSIQPRNQSSVWQNEYNTWFVRDKHAKAFSVLTNSVSVTMGRILRLPHPESAPKCLACHAVDVPISRQARTFDVSDGVSCESCHGAASKWLEQHTYRDWNYGKSVQLGMCNLRDLIKRSEICLSCHLGTSQNFVDHEMLAAGHPVLYFELDSFEAVMPRHWKYPPDTDTWIGVRTLAVGQAVQLRESLRQLVLRASGTVWPEYSELDCYACHHSLTLPSDSSRQKRGYSRRRPGNPPYNLSRYIVFRKVAEEMDPAAAQQLDSQMNQIYKRVSALTTDRNEVIGIARSASDTANGIAQRLAERPFDLAAGLRLMKAISADADAISAEGELSAEQAAMALQSLFLACSGTAGFKDVEQLRTAIKALFQQFQNPSSYNPDRFASQMRAVNGLL